MSCRHSGLHDVFLSCLVKDKRHGCRRFSWSGTPTLYGVGPQEKGAKKTKKETKAHKQQKASPPYKTRAIPDLSASPLVVSWRLTLR
ncbi:hypothetical protein J3E69DRAFT_325877 [Trichoderma sp. SZMC 28015]